MCINWGVAFQHIPRTGGQANMMRLIRCTVFGTGLHFLRYSVALVFFEAF